jgi:hypothetical protein
LSLGKTTASDVEADNDELGTSLAVGLVMAHRAALEGLYRQMFHLGDLASIPARRCELPTVMALGRT